MPTSKPTLNTPFNTVQHYENFPVASLLLPKHAVPAIQALYRFARAADDIADEGTVLHSERLHTLHDLAAQLDKPQQASNPLVRDCAPFILNRSLPVQYLQALLKAFIQDVVQDHAQHSGASNFRHTSMDSLLDYCSRSANPVGRMMLHAVGEPYAQCNAASFAASDHICTSLQLINFWQDMAKDALTGRVYIPQDVFERHSCPINSSAAGYKPMMHALCEDARRHMLAGVPLLSHLKGRFKAEIALTMAGGLRILDKLAACEYDVVNRRPTLSWRDAPACLRTVWQLYRGTLK